MRTPDPVEITPAEQQIIDSRLRELLPISYPATEPSGELHRRVAQFAATHEETTRRRASRWRIVRIGVALAGALALLLFASLVAPKLVAAPPLRPIEAAMGAGRRPHED